MTRLGLRWSAGLIALVTLPAIATERAWVYTHTIVKDVDNQQVAEVSNIASTNVEPMEQRVLIKIGNELLVARYTIGDPDPTNSSYKLLSTGETLSINDSNGSTVTVSLGSHSFTYQETDNSASVKAQAEALLGTASTTFQSTLNHFVTVGVNSYRPFYAHASELRDLFFPNQSIASSRNGKPEVTSEKANFNPNTTSPSTFDSAFGSAYYE